MPVTLTGTASAISSRAAPSIDAPASADFPSDVSNNQPDQELLDKIASLLAHAGLLDVIGTWTAQQTFSAAPVLSGGVSGPVAASGAVSGSSLSTPGNATVGGTLGVTGTTSLAAVNTSGLVTASGSVKPNAGLDLSSAPTPATVSNSKALNARNVVRGMIRIQHSAAFGSSSAAASYNCSLAGVDGTTYTVNVDMNEDMGTNLFYAVTDYDTSGGGNNRVTRVKSVSTVGGKTRITLNTTRGSDGADVATGNTQCGFTLIVWSMN